MQIDLTYAGARGDADHRLPLNEVVFDFYDRLKSVSRGYASFDYHLDGYEEGDLVKLNIMVNGDPVDALSCDRPPRPVGSPRPDAVREAEGPHPAPALQDRHPGRHRRQGDRRETVSALLKDVTAKCYGGDISRKRKLLDKQKEGKKKMRQYGNVEIPQSAFIAALKMHE